MIFNQSSFQINENGHLEIGGVDTVYLAQKYGTPLYVYDLTIVRNNCRSFLRSFEKLGVNFQVAYASKAFSSIGILQVIHEEGLSLDVVSEGELYTAIQANFPSCKIHLHGNNKSKAELEMAVENDVGCIVIDNFYEIELLEQLLAHHEKTMNVLIRVTPGIESNTHHYIMTGNEDSKFGFNLHNGQVDLAYERLKNHRWLNLQGLHSHIGSQIFETNGYIKANEILFKKLTEWYKKDRFIPSVLNLGGGFGIRYTKDDEPTPNEHFVATIVQAVQTEAEKLGIPTPEIWIEPGRSIVGDAGITLYTIGSMKKIPNIREYVSVDGGMTDNLRPALYDAKYEAIIANKAKEKVVKKVSIAGKCCESGDMLIWDLPVPHVESGDILAVFSTGAYGYSMASHYNRLPKPAVVFVEKGHDQLVIRRESYEDVVRYDLPYL